jgi:hydroxyacylglutathione hydrolase
MRKMNRQGPALLGTLAEAPALPADEFERVASSPEAFVAHIPGAINVGLGSSVATWAGTALPGGASIVLVLERSAIFGKCVGNSCGSDTIFPKGGFREE